MHCKMCVYIYIFIGFSISGLLFFELSPASVVDLLLDCILLSAIKVSADLALFIFCPISAEYVILIYCYMSW